MISIEEYKQQFKWLPKEDKLAFIRQELANIRFSQSSRPGQGVSRDGMKYYSSEDKKDKSPEHLAAAKGKTALERQKEQKVKEENDLKAKEMEKLLSEVENNVEAY